MVQKYQNNKWTHLSDESDATNNRKDTETSLIASLNESGTELKRKKWNKEKRKMGTVKMRTENQSDDMTDLLFSSEDVYIFILQPALYRKVMHCPRVQVLSGLKVEGEVPFVIFPAAAQFTAS